MGDSSEPWVDIQFLLNHNNTAGHVDIHKRVGAYTTSVGLPYSLGETNSVSVWQSSFSRFLFLHPTFLSFTFTQLCSDLKLTQTMLAGPWQGRSVGRVCLGSLDS